MKLYLIRHPKPEVRPGICYGRSDVDFAECPTQCAERLRPLLPRHYQLYSSPLQRALRLANVLGSPQVDARLEEMNFGDWELQPFDDFPEQVETWAQDPLGYKPPGGESGLEVAARIWDFHQSCVSPHQKAVVVVSHGGPLRLWLMQLLGLPLTQQHVLHLDFAKITQVELAPEGNRLVALNHDSSCHPAVKGERT